MAEVTIRTEFQTSVETVWNVVTDNERYGWRSDLEKIELSEDKNMFTEISCGGIKTDFTITEKKPFERYAFDMKNKNILLVCLTALILAACGTQTTTKKILS